jgi:DnaJ-class molecular chaperone
MKCMKCNGEGRVTFEEDGRMVTDACYRCGATGQVDEETDLQSRIEAAAGQLAVAHVDRMIAARNEDPEGEGWAFCAAENMMTERDYSAMHVYDAQGSIADQLTKLPRGLLMALLDVLVPPEPEPKPEPPPPEPSRGFDDGDDIPF